jgi:arsenate reductase
MRRERVLFLCTHNSARSQMAEAWLRALAGGRFEVASAGTEATRVHPLAVAAMDEVGVDLRAQTLKTLDAFSGERWDHVVTVCDSANERCPLFPGAVERVHWSFDNPSQARGTDESDSRCSAVFGTRSPAHSASGSPPSPCAEAFLAFTSRALRCRSAAGGPEAG